MGRVAAAAPRAKRRRTEQAGLHPAAVVAESSDPNPTEEPHIQLQELPPDAAGEGDGVDRISSLPDALLGEIISLLPTKDGARTQVIASRWRSLWLSAPLNLDQSSLTPIRTVPLLDIMSRILAAHPGPVRRLSVPIDIPFYGPQKLVVWLGSSAFDNLQELELGVGYMSYWEASPALRFPATLRVVTSAHCRIPPAAVEHFLLPQLGHLEFKGVDICDDTFHKMIAGCPALRYLLLNEIYKFDTIRINSRSLICIGFCYNNPLFPSFKEAHHGGRSSA